MDFSKIPFYFSILSIITNLKYYRTDLTIYPLLRLSKINLKYWIKFKSYFNPEA